MNARPGVAYRFWLRIEDERNARHWTKVKIAERAGLPRSTVDNLETSTRAPQARIVHALADVFGIPHDEAEVLAGVRRGPIGSGDPGVVSAIEASTVYDEGQKQLLLDLIRTIDQANGRTSGVSAPVTSTNATVEDGRATR